VTNQRKSNASTAVSTLSSLNLANRRKSNATKAVTMVPPSEHVCARAFSLVESEAVTPI
jgi:hypothetical protein